MSFYITLPSNSSSAIFPKNTQSHFITQLPSPQQLDGEWEVALVEIHFPVAWNNIDSTNDTFYVKDWDRASPIRPNVAAGYTTVSIDRGHYPNVQTLVDAMTTAMGDLAQKIRITYKRAMGKTVILTRHANIMFPEKYRLLADMLGIIDVGIPIGGEAADTRSRDWTFTHIPKYRADVARGQYNLYVYSDLVFPQLVGDTYAPLLRVVPVQEKEYGDIVHQTFQTLQYIPVSKRNFDTIEIDIRNDSGESIKFASGKTLIVLHFRLR